jgi:dimethylamine/trimethylamine dehydrogenase
MIYTLEHRRMFRTLEELGVTLTPQHLVSAIDAGVVAGRHVHSEKATTEWRADAVVLCTQRLSDDTLYRRLESDPAALAEAGISGLYRIGDCVVPRIAAEAIFDGHRLAREIDGENPAVARPFIRERRVLGATDADYDAVLGGTVTSAVALTLRNP